MLEQTGNDELAIRSVEWAVGLLDEWRQVNEEAQAIQRTLPATWARQVEQLPQTMRNLAPMMALGIHPKTVREAHAVMVSTIRVLNGIVDGSLSHPTATVEHAFGRNADEKTETGNVDERDVQRLEERMDRIEDLLNRLLDHRAARGTAQGAPRLDSAAPR